MWCNVNFVSVFTAFNNTIKQRQFNTTPYGENIYQLTLCHTGIKFKSGGLHFLKGFHHLKILEWTSGFRATDDLQGD